MTSTTTTQTILRADRLPLYWIGIGAALLVGFYLHRYLSFYALPGNVPSHPEGWWGWFDQGKYLESARAFASFDFASRHHWYPLGYALLAAPFVYLTDLHPFAAIDLFCLLACYFGFLTFAGRVGLGPLWATPLFILSYLFNPQIFAQWVVPWNTSVVSALLWVLLACAAAQMQGKRRPVLIGLLAAAIPLIRPTDGLLPAIIVLAVLISDRSDWRRSLALMVAGGLPLLAGYAALHYAVYGAAPSEYMILSKAIGFSFHDLGWKAYVILVDPGPWFLDGRGLLRRAPFLALLLPALPLALCSRRGTRLLAVLLILHTVLYLAYVDLLPTGLWRYYNVHYWSWAFPGATLLIVLFLKDLVLWRRAPLFPLSFVSATLSIPILCIHLVPKVVSADQPAKMLVFSGSPPSYDQAYFGPIALRDAAGEMLGIQNMRAIPVPLGMRVLALTRDFAGGEVWTSPPAGWTGSSAPIRYGEQIRLGRPCWIRAFRCPVATDDQLPPSP